MYLATANVTTNVNVVSNTSNTNSNEGSSYTFIKTTTNGESTIVESNESGEISVKSKNGQTTVKTSPGMKVNITSQESSPGAKAPKNASGSSFEIRTFFQRIESSIKKFFKFLRLTP